MLATIVTPSINTAQLFALIAAIIFVIAFLSGILTRTGTTNAGYSYIGGWLTTAGFVFIALALLWGIH
jgi:hypothetical protein